MNFKEYIPWSAERNDKPPPRPRSTSMHADAAAAHACTIRKWCEEKQVEHYNYLLLLCWRKTLLEHRSEEASEKKIKKKANQLQVWRPQFLTEVNNAANNQRGIDLNRWWNNEENNSKSKWRHSKNLHPIRGKVPECIMWFCQRRDGRTTLTPNNPHMPDTK